MLPTIGDSKGGGFVDRNGYGCGNRRRLSFGDLGLPDDTPFVEIARKKRFVCHRCRGRKVTVSAEWPRPKMGL